MGLAFLVPLALWAESMMADWFVDRAAEAGLDFRYFNGMSGELYFVENVGGGAALFDFDGDGDLDIYLAQGHMLGEGKTLKDAKVPPPAGVSLRGRLFRNDSQWHDGGAMELSFTDVTEQSGILADGYGMGAAAADYDNDGHVDLFLTNFGSNQLWRNLGDGRFQNVTEGAGLGTSHWSVSAAFVDYDRDGWLDLFVGNYTDFTLEGNKACFAPNSARDYCSPKLYGALPDRLYRNLGNGRFEDVTRRSGIDRAHGAALGVVAADFNRDGWLDVYVANDAYANQLWINQRDGTFRDEALLAGAAVSMEGLAQASMGIDAGDFDGDGDEDLFMTNLLGEGIAFYVNDGSGWFEDRALAVGMRQASKSYTGFGAGWLDFDNDGWMDVFTANGEVRIVPILAREGDVYPLHQTNQLFRNTGAGNFVEVTGQAGAVFALSEVSRGAAFGDIDNDGATDILVANNNGPARLLHNELAERGNWLGLRLIGAEGRDALGAWVEARLSDGRSLWRRVRSDGSYASSNDSRVLLGLGGALGVERLRVRWVDGGMEEWRDLGAGHYHELRRGTGSAVGSQPSPSANGTLENRESAERR